MSRPKTSAVPLSAVDRQRRDQALRLVQCFDNSGLRMDASDWVAKLRTDYEHRMMAAEDRHAYERRERDHVDSYYQEDMNTIWEDLRPEGMLEAVKEAWAVPEESRSEAQAMLIQAWDRFGNIERIVSNWVIADYRCPTCGTIYHNNQREREFIENVRACQACHSMNMARELAPEGASEEAIERARVYFASASR